MTSGSTTSMRSLAFLSILLFVTQSGCGGSAPRQFDAHASFEDLGITADILDRIGIVPVVPQEDPKTGFVVGGKNETSLILSLNEINGQSIESLEGRMRPLPANKEGMSREEESEYYGGPRSMKGFLGFDERLLEVLAEDNRYVVEELGLTHQALAKPLLVIPALWSKEESRSKDRSPVLTYGGRRFKVEVSAYKGHQLSPFLDNTKTNMDVTVTNLDVSRELKYSLLVPQMIERYGFYEGKGTPYRVEPRQVVEVFDFLKDQGK